MSITVFGTSIPLYGIFFWLGIFVAVVAAVFIYKKRELEGFDLVGSAIYAIICAIIGAKLLYLAVSWQDIAEYAVEYGLSLWELLPMLIKGGFVFYGGLIGGFLGILIYARQFRLRLSDFLDVYAVVLPLGHAFGRVGCHFGGCCYGIAYDGPFSIIYDVQTGMAPVGIGLFPVQLVEALLLVIIFAIQLLLFLKFKDKKLLCVYSYATLYCAVRFILEFLRGDGERGGFALFSTSQWISIAIITVMLAVAVRGMIKKRQST